MSKPNYKKTNMDVVPGDWKLKSLGEIGTFKKGRNISKNQLSSQGKPCVLYGEIYTKYDYIAKELTSYIPVEVAAQSTPIQFGDVLFASSGETAEEIGKCFAYMGEERAYAGGDLIIFSPKENDSKFLGYQLNSSLIVRQKATLGQGISVVHIYASGLATIKVPLPPLNEQRRIAEILGEWDNAITLTGRLIAARQRRKKALMQQLLTGKRRFGGFMGEWEEFRLEEVTEILLSNVDKKFDPEETTVRLCNYMDVHSNFYITNDLPFKCGSANEREINKFSLFKGDVIITKDSETPDDIANAAVVSEDLESTVCGYHLAILRPQKERIDGTFLMHHLHHPTINNQFARLANGVTRFGLTTDSIKHAKVKLPSIDEQRRIAAVLQTCDGEIALLEQKLSALKRQKQGLMQQLLTGKVRV